MKTLFLYLLLSLSLLAPAQEPELAIQSGHQESALCSEFSPDGKYLATGAKSTGEIILWDLNSGEEWGFLTGHTDDVSDLHFYNGGKKLVSLSEEDETIRLWDVAKRKNTKTIKLTANKGVVLPGDKILVTAYRGVDFISLATGSVIKHIDEIGGLYSMLDQTKDGKYIAVGGLHQVFIYNTQTYAKVATIDGTHDGLEDFSFSPDGYHLAVAYDSTLTLWSTSTWKEEKELHTGEEPLNSIRFSPVGNPVACGDDDNRIVFVDFQTGKIISQIQGGGFYGVNELAFSPDGKVLADITDDELEMTIYDVASDHAVIHLKGHVFNLTNLTASRDGKLLAYVGGENGGLKILDLSNGKIKLIEGEYSRVNQLAFNPKGDVVYIADDDLGISSWDIISGQMITALSPEGDWEGEMEFVGYNDSTNLVYSVDDKGQLYTLDPVTLKINNQYATPFEEVEAVSWSSNGKTAAISGNFSKKVDILNLSNGKTLKEYLPPTTGHLCNECKNYHLMPSLKSTTADGTMIRQDGLYDNMQAIAIAPSGKSLAASGGISTAIWNIADAKVKTVYVEPEITPVCMAYSPDGNYLAVGGVASYFIDISDTSQSKFPISIWNTTTGKLEARLYAHTNRVNFVQFTNDNRFLISGSYDGTIRYWDLTEKKEAASIFPVDETDFVITNKQGYYFTTKYGTKGVGFRVGGEVYPFESFDLRYNRPDIILKNLGYANDMLIKAFKDAYDKRLRKMQMSEASLSGDFHLPQIVVTSNEAAVTTNQSSFTVNIHAMDDLYNLDRIYIWVNGVPEAGSAVLKDKSLKDFSTTMKIALNQGDNKVEVSCLNEKGAESLHKSIYIRYEGEKKLPDAYVVAIGVSNYDDNNYNLSFAAKDASDFSDFFKSKSRTELYDSVYTLLLTDALATKENILATHNFLLKAKTDDRVVVFVSGHGLLDDSLNFYFATHDVDFTNPSQNGLKYENLEGLFDNIPCRQRLLLIDACHSGEIDKESVVWNTKPLDDGVNEKQLVSKGTKTFFGVENSFDIMQRTFADLRKGNGVTVIAASGGAEYSYEAGDITNGIFTYSLMQGLGEKEAATDDDDGINIVELNTYVSKNVEKLTEGKQVPVSRQLNLDNNFLIW